MVRLNGTDTLASALSVPTKNHDALGDTLPDKFRKLHQTGSFQPAPFLLKQNFD